MHFFHFPFSILQSPSLLALRAPMSHSSPGTPPRALSPADGDAPETPQVRKDLEIALCNSIDFDDDYSIAVPPASMGIMTCLPRPPIGEPPTTPLDETILGLRVEIDRLVDELALVKSRAELTSRAHFATVADHAEEVKALMSQVLQKGQLLAISKRDNKALTIEVESCKSTSTELRGAAIVKDEELRLTDKYVKYLEEGHSKSAPAGGILLHAPARFSVSTWEALGAVRTSSNLMCPKFLIPEGVHVRPFIAWIV